MIKPANNLIVFPFAKWSGVVRISMKSQLFVIAAMGQNSWGRQKKKNKKKNASQPKGFTVQQRQEASKASRAIVRK